MNPYFKTSARILLLTLSAFCLAPLGRAADHNIYMRTNGFDPAYLAVDVGDTVYWWNVDPSHSHITHSSTYPWYSGVLQPGNGVYLTVTRAGTFVYSDDSTGQTGTLVVIGTLEPTAATLTNPQRLADGRFQFTLTNLAVGTTYIIQGSPDFVAWTNLTTNIAASVTESWTDSAAAGFQRRFYRACSVP